MSTRPLVPGVILALVVAAIAATVHVEPAAAAAGTTFYVDGKHGNDNNTGLSWSEAFRTINHAAREIPRGNVAGWTVIVRGYSDHVYRERPVPGGFGRWGSPDAPLVFMADGWQPGSDSYVKPIVSGALVAPQAGHSWQADTKDGIWHTPWPQAPAAFDAAKPFSSAIFQNGTTALWQHGSLSDLRSRADRGDGGYWYDRGNHRLYVATKHGVSPGAQLIEVPTMMGFYFSGKDGSRHISIRGFVVQHTKLGIAFHLGADYNSALDNVARANTPMGFTTSGRVTASGADPATGNVFLRNSASFNTLQGFKIDAGSRDTVVCDNTARRNAVQGIKVQGPPKGSADPRVTSGTEICSNLLASQAERRPGAGRQDEQPNGLTIANGARGTYVHHNTIRDNLVGVILNQGYRGNPIANTRFSRNFLADNRSVGLNLRDGVNGARLGTGSLLASHNVYVGNGVGIEVAAGSSNKVFEHETVYDSLQAGWQIGCGCSSRASVTIRDSLATHNGGYGIAIASGQDVTVSHVGLPSNGRGSISGPADKTALNTKPAGYLSRDPGSPDFLRIAPSSYQYTAGPDHTPIGARY